MGVTPQTQSSVAQLDVDSRKESNSTGKLANPRTRGLSLTETPAGPSDAAPCTGAR